MEVGQQVVRLTSWSTSMLMESSMEHCISEKKVLMPALEVRACTEARDSPWLFNHI